MIKPLDRPKASKLEVVDFIKSFPLTEKVYLVGIRGYYKNSMGEAGENDIGIYDDAIFLVTPNDMFAYNANTDPSKYRKGIAMLLPGLHYFKKGKHGISKPGGGYPAIRPATPGESLPVSRYGQTGSFNGIAINIHKGSLNYTSSAGCQTIYPDQWNDFITKAYKAMDIEGQKIIPYILIEQ